MPKRTSIQRPFDLSRMGPLAATRPLGPAAAVISGGGMVPGPSGGRCPGPKPKRGNRKKTTGSTKSKSTTSKSSKATKK